MIPPLIVEYALDLGIEVIAITDHNASANIAAVQKAAINTPLHVFPGMEIQTREDVHSLCLFDTLGPNLQVAGNRYHDASKNQQSTRSFWRTVCG